VLIRKNSVTKSVYFKLGLLTEWILTILLIFRFLWIFVIFLKKETLAVKQVRVQYCLICLSNAAGNFERNFFGFVEKNFWNLFGTDKVLNSNVDVITQVITTNLPKKVLRIK